MKSFIKTIVMATGMFSIVGMVAAPNAEAGKGKHRGQHAQRLMKHDVNGDGALARSELTNGLYARAAEKMKKNDANGDGFLDREELKAAHTARRAEFQAKRAAKLEANPELKAKFEKKRAHRAEKWEGKKGKRGERMTKRFARVDTNGDGRLALFEMQAAADRRVTKMFERLDANGDGQIDAEEIAAKKKGHRRSNKL